MLDSQESGEGRTLACDSLKLLRLTVKSVCENFVFEKRDRQTERERESERERERVCVYIYIYISVCVCACVLVGCISRVLINCSRRGPISSEFERFGAGRFDLTGSWSPFPGPSAGCGDLSAGALLAQD